ncbi:hypothetical protein HK407_09g15200 [Ordospora pajunii]|uniref:uncharacterized protein n=1 Tax=Ordospora pajunii TaxID=3039483 RepID=UPI0029527BA2|nr:uncharacterized protein HK407_09g15200 [Ordospora pajunii]KAH9410925.1 hypothetical protein HK407_09g15200 [Ordospora pajunii]
MERFFYLCDLSFFSSSMVQGSIIACDKMGTIHTIMPIMGEIAVDHFKKDIKFYPVDDLCFTTADMVRGIRVWDRCRAEIVYSYKEDSIRMHAYGNNGCMAAVGEGSVKLYDLRVRYSIDAIPVGMCKMAEWGDSRVYCVGESSIVEYDTRNLCNMVSGQRSEDRMNVGKLEGVIDFASMYKGEFCILKRNGSLHLQKIEGLKEVGGYERPTVGSKMIKIRNEIDDFAIGVLDENRVCVYEYRDTWACAIDGVHHVDWMWFCQDNCYVFADRKVYLMEGGYEEFKKAMRKGE